MVELTLKQIEGILQSKRKPQVTIQGGKVILRVFDKSKRGRVISRKTRNIKKGVTKKNVLVNVKSAKKKKKKFIGGGSAYQNYIHTIENETEKYKRKVELRLVTKGKRNINDTSELIRIARGVAGKNSNKQKSISALENLLTSDDANFSFSYNEGTTTEPEGVSINFIITGR